MPGHLREYVKKDFSFLRPAIDDLAIGETFAKLGPTYMLTRSIIQATLLTLCCNFCTGQPVISLFDGQTFDGWETLDGDPVTRGWEVVDGAIHLQADGPRAGNIVTKTHFSDYDLRFEWKISAGGNSGIKYRVRKFGDRVLGCEFQILDDDAHRQFGPRQMNGSLYALYEPTSGPARPAEFNRSRIVVRGNRIQHWVNGELVVEANAGSADWRDRKAASKFADVDGFGENRWGRIMLTDHDSEVWYRNLTLELLDKPVAEMASSDSPTISEQYPRYPAVSARPSVAPIRCPPPQQKCGNLRCRTPKRCHAFRSNRVSRRR